jgi:hypothetical protein
MISCGKTARNRHPADIKKRPPVVMQPGAFLFKNLDKISADVISAHNSVNEQWRC